jgi:hypothetical protein
MVVTAGSMAPCQTSSVNSLNDTIGISATKRAQLYNLHSVEMFACLYHFTLSYLLLRCTSFLSTHREIPFLYLNPQVASHSLIPKRMGTSKFHKSARASIRQHLQQTIFIMCTYITDVYDERTGISIFEVIKSETPLN